MATAPAVKPFPLEFWKLVRQLAVVPTKWVVEGLIPQGGLNFLVAKPKVGKTTLARTLASAIVQGAEWLGQPCTPGEVWYLAYEGRLADHASHFHQLQVPADAPLVIQEQSPFPGHLPAMFAEMRKRHPVLVIIDHIQLALQLPKINDPGLVTIALQPFIEVTRETGSTFLFNAHARKGQLGGGDEDAIDALAGAGAFGGACDTYILLKKSRGGTNGAYRTIQTEQRIGDSLTPTILVFDKQAGSLRLAGDAYLYRAQQLELELYDVLVQEGALSEDEWFAHVKGATTDKRTARRHLLKDGRIIRTGSGLRGQPYTYVTTEVNSGFSSGVISGPISPPIFPV